MNKLTNYTKKLETLQNVLIANSDDSCIYGDGGDKPKPIAYDNK